MKFRVAKLYKIVFWDHAVGIRNAVKCEAVGWCIDDNRVRVLLSHWKVIEDEQDVIDNNHEYTSIIKTCIISRKVIG